MRVQRYHFLGLAALSSALVLSSSKVGAATTSSEESTITFYSSSSGCVVEYIGDGDCDLFNNNEECGGYDGGDCCECTCVDTDFFVCGAGYHGGYTCIDPSAECVDDDDATINPNYENPTSTSRTTSSSSSLCFRGFASDGECDPDNNTEACDYDGGDCCECTCVDNIYACGEMSGFGCVDPSAPCVDDDDYDPSNDDDGDSTFSTDDDISDSSSSVLCRDGVMGDGNCDLENNIDECGYDSGDCCECDCVSTSGFTCGDDDYDCIDPSSSCINGYVLASTKTTITASANAYDTRPGEASSDIGCGEDGCAAALSLDGLSDDTESRWSCAQKIVPDGGLCEIEFTFDDPQDVMEVQVAFWKGDERSRTLEATINGEVIGEFDSYTGSTFNALGIAGVGVETMAFTTVGLTENDWISLIEVRFLVEP